MPRHLPSSGFKRPLDGLLPSVPRDGPSTVTASMGFALQGLAPPGRRAPLTGPLLSCRFPARTRRPERPRLQRFVPTGEGPDRVARHRDGNGPNLAFLGFRPSRAFSSTAFEPASRLQPLMPFRPKVLPTFPLPGGASGDFRTVKAAGLSRGCRPSWGFAPARHLASLWVAPAPGSSFSPPRGILLSEAHDRSQGTESPPDRSSTPGRVGATDCHLTPDAD
jgi:hypothetical protein